jgi:cell shape-determining protein MreC
MKKIPILIKASIMLGLERSGYIVSKMRPDVFVGANALESLILFGQRFIQGKSFDAEPFEQLELTEAEVDKIYKKKRKRKLDLEQLKQETEDQDFLFKNLDPERISLIKQ